MHDPVHRMLSQLGAQLGITAIGRNRTNGICRINCCHIHSHLMLRFCISLYSALQEVADVVIDKVT